MLFRSKDVTHDQTYRRQRFVPADLPPPTAPRALVDAAGAACLASPVAGGKFMSLSFNANATCGAVCSNVKREATCLRGWTLFVGDQSFDFGNECAALSSAPGMSVKGRLCCCMATSGPQLLLPPDVEGVVTH